MLALSAGALGGLALHPGAIRAPPALARGATFAVRAGPQLDKAWLPRLRARWRPSRSTQTEATAVPLSGPTESTPEPVPLSVRTLFITAVLLQLFPPAASIAYAGSLCLADEAALPVYLRCGAAPRWGDRGWAGKLRGREIEGARGSARERAWESEGERGTRRIFDPRTTPGPARVPERVRARPAPPRAACRCSSRPATTCSPPRRRACSRASAPARWSCRQRRGSCSGARACATRL